jgi:hypothetical protein
MCSRRRNGQTRVKVRVRIHRSASASVSGKRPMAAIALGRQQENLASRVFLPVHAFSYSKSCALRI